ncbi:MAG TPA: hypothetical protein VGV91_07760 [Rubrobacter sp.]|nr:hypothetical protein [Rubrobacter sp.]
MQRMARMDGRRTWKWTAVLFAAIVLGTVGVLLYSQPAVAHDHEPPKTVLMKGSKELQAGRLTDEYRWSYPSPNGKVCWTDEATIPFAFPKSLPTVVAGSTLKVRVYKRHEPMSLLIQEIDLQGQPRGEVAAKMRPVVRDGKTVAWDAVFTVDRPNALYRLMVDGHWQDRDCSVGPIDPDQFARWTFRLKTGSLPGAAEERASSGSDHLSQGL